MSRRLYVSLAIVAAIICSVNAQQPQTPAPQAGRGAAARVTRPPLFFSEEWRQTPANDEHPVTQQSVANPSLELKLYGSTAKEIQLTGAANNENNPTHVWTGMCSSPCALAFKHKTNYADLTGLARIRWNTKTSGFHEIRPIVKLADGTWLVGDRTDGSTRDWLITEFNVADVHWLKLDIERIVTTGNIVERPDLTKVDEIGFVDLMPGSGHGPGGWSDVAQVDVFAAAVPRTASTK
ncbi:MAG TPA: hypothetical protein VFB92_00285 [Vicinamibacterales bacterium]|jgi:hypothetical protein|nr:hypothetical protein [Vicinamibacterales bacterium]